MNTLTVTSAVEPSPDQLLELGRIVADLSLRIALPKNKRESLDCRAVLAGIVVTLQTLLAPAQFRQVLLQWEIEQGSLDSLLELAGASPIQPNPEVRESLSRPGQPEDDADRLVREALEDQGIIPRQQPTIET